MVYDYTCTLDYGHSIREIRYRRIGRSTSTVKVSILRDLMSDPRVSDVTPKLRNSPLMSRYDKLTAHSE